MRYRTIGYYVTDENRTPLEMGSDGVLWIGDATTAFTSYERARSAVRRSYTFAARENLSWGHGFDIRRLVYSCHE